MKKEKARKTNRLLRRGRELSERAENKGEKRFLLTSASLSLSLSRPAHTHTASSFIGKFKIPDEMANSYSINR